jgi:hypothetical protein
MVDIQFNVFHFMINFNCNSASKKVSITAPRTCTKARTCGVSADDTMRTTINALKTLFFQVELGLQLRVLSLLRVLDFQVTV